MAKRAQIFYAAVPELPAGDNWLHGLLHEIEQEKTPDRLLKLALQLQEKLVLQKQLERPN